MTVGPTAPGEELRVETSLGDHSYYYEYPTVDVSASNETVTHAPFSEWPTGTEYEPLIAEAVAPTTLVLSHGVDEVTIDGVAPLDEKDAMTSVVSGADPIAAATWLWDSPATSVAEFDYSSHAGWDSQPDRGGDWYDLFTYTTRLLDSRRGGVPNAPPEITQPAADRFPATSLTDRVQTAFRATPRSDSEGEAFGFETFYAYPEIDVRERRPTSTTPVLDPDLEAVVHTFGPPVRKVTLDGSCFLDEKRGLDVLRRMDPTTHRLAAETWLFDSPNVVVSSLSYSSNGGWDDAGDGVWRPVVDYSLTLIDNRQNLPGGRDAAPAAGAASIAGATGTPSVPVSAIAVTDSGIWHPTRGGGVRIESKASTAAGTIEFGGISQPFGAAPPESGDTLYLRMFGESVDSGIVEKAGTDGQGLTTVTAFGGERLLHQTEFRRSFSRASAQTVVQAAFDAAGFPVEFHLPEVSDDDSDDTGAEAEAPSGAERAVEQQQRDQNLDAPLISQTFQGSCIDAIQAVCQQSNWLWKLDADQIGFVAHREVADNENLDFGLKTHELVGVTSDTDIWDDPSNYDAVIVTGSAAGMTPDGTPLPVSTRPFQSAIVAQEVDSLADADRIYRPDPDGRIDTQQKCHAVARALWRELQQIQAKGGRIACTLSKESVAIRPLDTVVLPEGIGTTASSSGEDTADAGGEEFSVHSVEHRLSERDATTEISIGGVVVEDEIPEPFCPN